MSVQLVFILDTNIISAFDTAGTSFSVPIAVRAALNLLRERESREQRRDQRWRHRMSLERRRRRK